MTRTKTKRKEFWEKTLAKLQKEVCRVKTTFTNIHRRYKKNLFKMILIYNQNKIKIEMEHRTELGSDKHLVLGILKINHNNIQEITHLGNGNKSMKVYKLKEKTSEKYNL